MKEAHFTGSKVDTMKNVLSTHYINYMNGKQLLQLGKQHLSDHQRGTHPLRGTLPATSSQADRAGVSQHAEKTDARSEREV